MKKYTIQQVVRYEVEVSCDKGLTAALSTLKKETTRIKVMASINGASFHIRQAGIETVGILNRSALDEYTPPARKAK